MSGSTPDDRLLDLARRLLAGEAIDWEKEGVEESVVREGMKRLQHLMPRGDGATETKEAPPPEPPSPPPRPTGPRNSADRYIGDFRLVRKLGEGGMGVVYEAEQQHPHRPVALKVIRGGRHVDAHALRLFQREIQTLARLSHPGIAQLYETGVTDDGMHFFAMELVRGVPLADWLKKRSAGPLTPAEMRIRLGVFRRICDAVAYAHQKGVIHRDLKPGNILIPTAKTGSSSPDAVPEVKILDFGLARMTDADVQMTTYVTEMGKMQGTLPYMSPEQVRGNPDEIDLRTDVYSLGVILYEMVTGKLPHDLTKAQLPEAVRIICEEPPRSLTTTFSGTKRIDADIVTIANKCLEKETARRYQSAAALGEDVQRYLTDQPILARPPSAVYQFRKLVLRHKGPFAAAAGIFVLLIAFSIGMTAQAIRIGRERDRANVERDRASQERDRANQEAETSRRVSDFLEGMFKSSDPWASREKALSPQDLLDAGAERIELELKGQPKIQARLLRTMGVAYGGLGMGEKAASILKRALELTESEFAPDSLELAEVLHAIGGIDNHARALAIRQKRLPPNDPRIARSYWYLGLAQTALGRPEGEATLERGLQVAEKASPPDDQTRLFIFNDLTAPCVRRHEYERAIQLMQDALAIRERLYHADHPDLIQGRVALGYLLTLAGRYQDASRYVTASAIEDLARVLGPSHPSIPIAIHSLGELQRRLGRLDDARRSLERCLAFCEKAYGPDDGVFIDPLTSLGLVDDAQGRTEAAIGRLGRAVVILRKWPGPSTLDPRPDYARVLRKAGRIAEAEQIEATLKAEGAR